MVLQRSLNNQRHFEQKEKRRKNHITCCENIPQHYSKQSSKKLLEKQTHRSTKYSNNSRINPFMIN